jgi:adenylate cyclase
MRIFRTFRFPLRRKFFLFAVLISAAPLVLVGENLLRIARDELKSAANEQLLDAADDIARRIDDSVAGVWFAPLRLIRNAVDTPSLDVREKIALMTHGLSDIPGVVALQLTVAGSDLPILVTDQAFSARLAAAGLDPLKTLRLPGAEVARLAGGGRPEAMEVPEAGTWLATVVLPLRSTLNGAPLVMSARLDLARIGTMVRAHPLLRRGEVSVIDASGLTVLEPSRRDVSERAIARTALGLIGGDARPAGVEGYKRADGAPYLGAYAFTDSFAWAVVAELRESSAYGVVRQMTINLVIWVTVGFLVAGGAALWFAWRLTRPILTIGAVANRVGQGDFRVRVEGVRSRDEIGDLAERINVMIRELSERLELMKFVSRGTVSAVRDAGEGGVHRGGERRRVTMLFSDIRGYTAFSEAVDPEIVVDMLNLYLDTQARIVEEMGGDVDKFIADEMVALFQGPDMERRALACALAIQDALSAKLRDRPEWDLHVGIGVHAGEVVMGATGSRSRMDFTVLGDAVNLAARLCAAAPPDRILTTAEVHEAAKDAPGLAFEELEPVTVKGKSRPVAVYSVTAAAEVRPEAGVSAGA